MALSVRVGQLFSFPSPLMSPPRKYQVRAASTSSTSFSNKGERPTGLASLARKGRNQLALNTAGLIYVAAASFWQMIARFPRTAVMQNGSENTIDLS